MPTTNESYLPATVLARAAGRHLSTIHRWCRRGFVRGAIRGTGPGRQPWLIPASEVTRLTTTALVEVWP
jgi:hypothetical protein